MSLPARTLAQLGFVALNDADAMRPSHAWPPAPRLTAEQQKERERLYDLADQLFAEAKRGGFVGGTDAAFGEEGARRG
jgi:hypothetical protein